jgi:ABC-2 type transport system permease protein
MSDNAKRPSSSRAALRPHVIKAVVKRNIASFFASPAGYVFITLFVFIGALAAFWQPIFFANNLANLAPLNAWMPYLLLFFIPAITMSAWAEERRLGTDELLLTLPARDYEIVVGKYLASLGIYTISLLFALSYVLILNLLGKPDLGVIFANYIGYWFMGVALVAIGLVASSISNNLTVGFILGGVFCAIPVFLNLFSLLFSGATGRTLGRLSIPSQFADFGTGVIPISSVFYFLGIAASMIYLNVLMIGRRNWAGGPRGRSMWGHGLVRVACLVVSVISLFAVINRAGARVDATSERLHTLSRDSRNLISAIPPGKPVLVQAYYSPTVPGEYVQVKDDLINNLKEIAALGGSKIRLSLLETDLFSENAREAEKRFGIQPRRVLSTSDARQSSEEIFMGVAFTSGLEEVVVPFFDRGLPVEYELIRSIQVVSRTNRKKVGILGTDAKLLGGFDFRSSSPGQEWSIVTELKKQYEVIPVSADAPIQRDFDCLIVAQPASLPQRELDNLMAYIRSGGPAMLLADPLPTADPSLAPESPRQPTGGAMGGGSPPPEPKADLKPLMDMIGLEWPPTEIVWNGYNPHPQLADLPPEVVFVGPGSGQKEAFNASQPVTSGLQEVVMIFPGLIRTLPSVGPKVEPLLKTSDAGGLINFRQATSPSFFGSFQINPNRGHFPTGQPYTLAVRVTGTPGTPKATVDAQGKPFPPISPTAPTEEKLNVVVVSDLDVIGEEFFDLRRRGIENLEFDNVTFVLNCVDELAGDLSFVNLRKRRVKHRTLTKFEEQTQQFIKSAAEEAKVAEREADDKLKSAQKRLNERVSEIESRKDLDDQTKEVMIANVQETENRRLVVEKTKIDDEKRSAINESRMIRQSNIRSIENRFRFLAILLPPLPSMILGIWVLGRRLARENRNTPASRMA